MKAIVWTTFGPPKVLQLQGVATPAPAAHEVLIKIYATAVSAEDCEPRSLQLPPAYRLAFLIGVGLLRRIRSRPFIMEFSLPSGASTLGGGIVAGPDGNLWFTDAGYPAKIGRISPDGKSIPPRSLWVPTIRSGSPIWQIP